MVTMSPIFGDEKVRYTYSLVRLSDTAMKRLQAHVARDKHKYHDEHKVPRGRVRSTTAAHPPTPPSTQYYCSTQYCALTRKHRQPRAPPLGPDGGALPPPPDPPPPRPAHMGTQLRAPPPRGLWHTSVRHESEAVDVQSLAARVAEVVKVAHDLWCFATATISPGIAVQHGEGGREGGRE